MTTDFSVAGFTVNVTEPFTVPSVATMDVVPAATGVTIPVAAPTVATLGTVDVQAAVVVRVVVLESLLVPVAVSCTVGVTPSVALGLAGPTVIEVNVTGVGAGAGVEDDAPPPPPPQAASRPKIP